MKRFNKFLLGEIDMQGNKVKVLEEEKKVEEMKIDEKQGELLIEKA
jgi:hypothetical protein